MKKLNDYDGILDDEDFIELSEMKLNEVKKEISDDPARIELMMAKIKGLASRDILPISLYKNKNKNKNKMDNDLYFNIMKKIESSKNKNDSIAEDVFIKKSMYNKFINNKKVMGSFFIALTASSSYLFINMNNMLAINNTSDYNESHQLDYYKKNYLIKFDSFYVYENDTFDEIIKRKWSDFYHKELFGYFNSISLNDKISLMKNGNVIHVDHFFKKNHKRYSYVLVGDFLTKIEDIDEDLFLSADEISVPIDETFSDSIKPVSLFNGNEDLAKKSTYLALKSQDKEIDINKLKDGDKVYLYIVSLKDKKNGNILDIKNVKIKSIDHNRHPSSTSVAVTGL